ncbi:MAG: hypothetical protein V7734_07020 [Maribacter arcticus]|uniref:hypothetical protein n=1 Tax=Maribacter arcticus TaxID=561365 RepID=UPI003001D9CE
MKNTELDKIKETLHNNFKLNCDEEFLIEVDYIDNIELLNISFFWGRINSIYWKNQRTFGFNKNDYNKMLEFEIKPFILKHQKKQ